MICLLYFHHLFTSSVLQIDSFSLEKDYVEDVNQKKSLNGRCRWIIRENGCQRGWLAVWSWREILFFVDLTWGGSSTKTVQPYRNLVLREVDENDVFLKNIIAVCWLLEKLMLEVIINIKYFDELNRVIHTTNFMTYRMMQISWTQKSAMANSCGSCWCSSSRIPRRNAEVIIYVVPCLHHWKSTSVSSHFTF